MYPLSIVKSKFTKKGLTVYFDSLWSWSAFQSTVSSSFKVHIKVNHKSSTLKIIQRTINTCFMFVLSDSNAINVIRY